MEKSMHLHNKYPSTYLVVSKDKDILYVEKILYLFNQEVFHCLNERNKICIKSGIIGEGIPVMDSGDGHTLSSIYFMQQMKGFTQTLHISKKLSIIQVSTRIEKILLKNKNFGDNFMQYNLSDFLKAKNTRTKKGFI